MKKTVVLIAFLFVMSAALIAAQANNVTSYDPSKRIENPSLSIMGEMKVRAAAGDATRTELRTMKDNELSCIMPAIPATRDNIVCPAFAENYGTGSTDGTTLTEASLAKCEGYIGVQGWFLFDVSGIPDGSTINSVTLNGYIYEGISSSWWGLTPLSMDPRVPGIDCAALVDDIEAEASSGYYASYTTAASGSASLPMTAVACTDLEAALAQDWFGVGLCSRDWSYENYRVGFNGWNETNPPTLVVDYNPPITVVSLSGASLSATYGNVSTEFVYEIMYANPDGTAPTTYDVVIDDVPHAMTPPDGTPDYTTWQTFVMTTTLAVGNHEYYFEFVGTGTTVRYPDTAPGTQLDGPVVYSSLSGTVVIDHAGGGDFTTFQDCFNALETAGTDGSPINIEVTAGTYEEAATLTGPITGVDALNSIHMYPQGGTVIVDGYSDLASLYFIDVSHVWVQGFTLIGGQNAGFRAENGDGMWLSNCDINNNDWLGIGLLECSNAKVWNNMVSNNKVQQIRIDAGGLASGNLIWSNSTYPLYNNEEVNTYNVIISDDECTFINNIMHHNHYDAGGYCVLVMDMDMVSHPNTVSDYNVFYSQNGVDIVALYDSGDDEITASFATLADWQAGSGLDANSVEGNPFFDDPNNMDLHINSGSSSAYQAGTNTGAWFSDDFDGDTRTTPWDIGAEVVVLPPSPVLSVGSVSPTEGDQLMVYQWYVNFFHPLGVDPTNVKLIRDNNDFGAVNMTLLSGVPSNGTYTYTSTMAPGNHEYYFTASTDMGPLRLPEMGNMSGPQVTEYIIPTIPYSQSFDEMTELPDYWYTEGLGLTNWSINTTSNAGGSSPELMLSYNPTFDGMSRCVSAPMITTGVTSIEGSFKHYVNDYSGGYTIGMATTSDGGATWNTVWSMEGEDVAAETVPFTIANGDVGSNQFQFCFFLDGYSYNLNQWYIDDITMLQGTPNGVTIVTEDLYGGGLPGNDVMYPVEIQNSGSVADTYDLAAADNEWNTTFWNTPAGTRNRSQITDTGEIAAGASTTVYVKVVVDPSAEEYDSDVATITATSQGDPNKSDNMEIETECYPSYDFDSAIDANMKSGFAGSVVEYIVTIDNIGGADDTYDLTIDEDDWTTVWVDGASVAVNTGQSYGAIIQVTCSGAIGETDTTNVTVTSQGNSELTETFQIITKIIPTEGAGVGFYYTWKNSGSATGPTYDWYTPVTRAILDPMPDDDGCVGPFPLGFDFPFYGDMVNQFYVNSNGTIDFYAPDSSFSGQNIPSATVPNGLVALYWDDLNPLEVPLNGTPAIYQEAAFIDGKNAHVITYDHYGEYDNSDLGYYFTGQIILFEDGCVKMQYQEFHPGFDMDYATIGLENQDGTDAVLYSYHEYSVWDGVAIMFYYEPIEYNVSIDNTTMTLSWDAVTGADTYNVYGCDDPYGVYPDDYVLVTNTADLFYDITPEPMKFYVITAQAPEVVRLRNREEEIQQAQKAKK